MFMQMAARRRRMGGFSPLALFAASEQGVWLDPSDLSTLFQDHTGTTPVTAAGQSVGLVLGKSKGLVLGPELFSGAPSALGVGWVNNGNGTYSIDGTQGATSDLVFSLGLVSGRHYRITYTVTGGAGSIRAQVGASGLEPFSAARGARSLTLLSSSANITFQAGAGVTGTISVVSVCELPGNHATQAVFAARPIYRVSSGIPHIEDDLIDYSINWTAPAGSYTVAWCDTAGSVTIQTAQALSGATDAMKAQRMVGYLAINRALTAAETANLTAWFQRKAGG